MSNHIMVIAPYWLEEAGTWVFDDPAAGLHQEPFVSGVPEMRDQFSFCIGWALHWNVNRRFVRFCGKVGQRNG
jgi:hypothetical protein